MGFRFGGHAADPAWPHLRQTHTPTTRAQTSTTSSVTAIHAYNAPGPATDVDAWVRPAVASPRARSTVLVNRSVAGGNVAPAPVVRFARARPVCAPRTSTSRTAQAMPKGISQV